MSKRISCKVYGTGMFAQRLAGVLALSIHVESGPPVVPIYAQPDIQEVKGYSRKAQYPKYRGKNHDKHHYKK
jgi:hypothetical protein